MQKLTYYEKQLKKLGLEKRQVLTEEEKIQNKKIASKKYRESKKNDIKINNIIIS